MWAGEKLIYGVPTPSNGPEGEGRKLLPLSSLGVKGTQPSSAQPSPGSVLSQEHGTAFLWQDVGRVLQAGAWAAAGGDSVWAGTAINLFM